MTVFALVVSLNNGQKKIDLVRQNAELQFKAVWRSCILLGGICF